MSFDFEELDRIINAGSLAIVGASNTPMKFGTLFAASQSRMGFQGPMYFINPREKEILGQPVYPDLLSLPEAPELVYLTIPALRSIEVLEDCAELEVKGVVMLAAGFSESGEDGEALEKEALKLARRGGFRIIGPNCFGIYNPRNGLTMLPGYDFSRTPGEVAFFSQSGGFGVHVVREGLSLGLRFRAAVSYGNAADIDETDLIRYFALDEGTGIIAGYIEGVRRGREFASALKQAASAKPLVIWKVGGGGASQRAVVSHTGSMAGSKEIWESLMSQHGVIRASGVDEVLDTIIAIKHLGMNPGKRLLVSGGGGGLGTYAAELAEKKGLFVPLPDENTMSELQEALGRAGAVAGNPLDIGAPLIPLDEFQRAMTAAARDESTDVLVFDMALNFAHDLVGEPGLDHATDIMVESAKESHKPTAVVMYLRSCDPDDLELEALLRRYREKLLDNGVAVFPSMERALNAISRINI